MISRGPLSAFNNERAQLHSLLIKAGGLSTESCRSFVAVPVLHMYSICTHLAYEPLGTFLAPGHIADSAHSFADSSLWYFVERSV